MIAFEPALSRNTPKFEDFQYHYYGIETGCNYKNNLQALARLLLTRRESISVLNKATRPSFSDSGRAKKNSSKKKTIAFKIYLHVLKIDKTLLLSVDIK